MFLRKSSKQLSASSSGRTTRSESVHGGNSSGRNRRALSSKRSMSCPPSTGRIKGIMKFATVDESLDSRFAENSKHGPPAVDDDGGRRRTLVFKEIQIREYGRTVGDNPSCSSGPPITITWEYDPDLKVISVDQYEDNRPPRRTHFEMVLPRDLRQHMLRKEWEVSQNQIASAVRTNIKVKNQRRATVNNIGKAERMEQIMESTGKKVLGGFMMKKSTNKELQKLQKQMDEANKKKNTQFFVNEQMNEDDDTVTYTETPPVSIEDEEVATASIHNNSNNYAEQQEQKRPRRTPKDSLLRPTNVITAVEESEDGSDDDDNNNSNNIGSSNNISQDTTPHIPSRKESMSESQGHDDNVVAVVKKNGVSDKGNSAGTTPSTRLATTEETKSKVAPALILDDEDPDSDEELA